MLQWQCVGVLRLQSVLVLSDVFAQHHRHCECICGWIRQQRYAFCLRPCVINIVLAVVSIAFCCGC